MNCKLCSKPVEKQDFCYGCKSYICQQCNDTYPDVPGGKHALVDHILLKKALTDLKKAQKEVDRITSYSDFLTKVKNHE